MTLEFSADGKTEGRNSVVLPAPDPDGRIRFLAPIPIEKYGPGRHELKVTVRQAGAQAEERVAFTLRAVARPRPAASASTSGSRTEPFATRMDPMRDGVETPRRALLQELGIATGIADRQIGLSGSSRRELQVSNEVERSPIFWCILRLMSSMTQILISS